MTGVLGRRLTTLFSSIYFYNVEERAASLTTRNYRAAVLNEFKKPLEIVDKKSPKKLKKGEIRLKVKCCSVNASDVLICNEAYDITPKIPFTPGFELVGQVTEVGEGVDKDELNVGDKVLALNKDHFSGWAEECIVSAEDAWQVTATGDPKVWCGLADSYSTALIGLARRSRIKQGEAVLITAAAGGLGLAAVDVAANVYKSKVIAVCETEDKASLVRDRGAWAALTFNPKDILKKVKEVTNGKGVRVIFDSVGANKFEDLLKCVSHEGNVVVAGVASRQVPHIKTNLLLPQSFSLIGVSLRNYRAADFEVYRQIVSDAIDMCEQGLVSPQITKTFSLEHINDAVEFVSSQKTTGKVVVTMEDDD